MLEKALRANSLTEEAEGYLLGRGVKESTYKALGAVVWQPLPEPLPLEGGWLRFGREGRGELLEGRLILPLRCPRGKLLGFEARSIYKKEIARFLLPRAEWLPVWGNMTTENMVKIWNGGNVWIGEGFFDAAALEWAVPEGDVCLASMRAKLTKKHIDFLKRFCRGIVNMVYDNDETGRLGTHGDGDRVWGALKSLQVAKIPCRDVLYTGGKDPGEVWVKRGADGLRDELMQRRIS